MQTLWIGGVSDINMFLLGRHIFTSREKRMAHLIHSNKINMSQTWIDAVKRFLERLIHPEAIIQQLLFEIIFSIIRRYRKPFFKIVFDVSMSIALLVTFPVRLFITFRWHPYLRKADSSFFVRCFFIELIKRTYMIKHSFIPLSIAGFFSVIFKNGFIDESHDDSLALAELKAQSYGCTIEETVKLRYFVRELVCGDPVLDSLLRKGFKDAWHKNRPTKYQCAS